MKNFLLGALVVIGILYLGYAMYYVIQDQASEAETLVEESPYQEFIDTDVAVLTDSCNRIPDRSEHLMCLEVVDQYKRCAEAAEDIEGIQNCLRTAREQRGLD